jgi:hypothetical protein
MAKTNFSGVYTLKSSENEDAFLDAQGVGCVLRKAAKVEERRKLGEGGSKRVVIEHSGDNLKIKAGLVDLEYVIGGAPLPTSCMGFECTDACAWQSDGVALVQTKRFTDGSKVTTVLTLSSDRQLLTEARRWVDKNSGSEGSSTKVLQRVVDLPSGSEAQTLLQADEPAGSSACNEGSSGPAAHIGLHSEQRNHQVQTRTNTKSGQGAGTRAREEGDAESDLGAPETKRARDGDMPSDSEAEVPRQPQQPQPVAYPPAVTMLTHSPGLLCESLRVAARAVACVRQVRARAYGVDGCFCEL